MEAALYELDQKCRPIVALQIAQFSNGRFPGTNG